MPTRKIALKILIASPADAAQARSLLAECIQEWNHINSDRSGVVLEAIRWETNSRPELGDSAQAIINKQIVGASDLVIACFWTRLGTPTESSISGTAEEIDKAVAGGKNALVYFIDEPVSPPLIDVSEMDRLRLFRRDLMKRGLVHSVSSFEVLRADFGRHLGQTINSMLANLQQDETEYGQEKSAVQLLDHLWRRLSALRQLIQHEIPRRMEKMPPGGHFDIGENFAPARELYQATFDYAPFLPDQIIEGIRQTVSALESGVNRAYKVLKQAAIENRSANEPEILARFNELYSALNVEYAANLDKLARRFREVFTGIPETRA